MSVLPLLAAVILTQTVAADLPLYEQEPFDRITLNAANEGAVLEVEPLDLPDRRVPEKPKPGDKLRVRLLSRPGVEYEVPWQSIEKVELFEQMVLAEAVRRVNEGKLEEAYDYFAFLERHHAELPGLAEAADAYLYEEAKAAHRAGHFDRALAMLRENYRRNPKREGLDKALGMATARRIDEYVARGDYAAVRALVRNLTECFPGHEVASQWTSRLTEQAESLLAEAREAVAERRYGEASRLCREVAAVWPELPDARELAQEVHARYPRVVVAVASLAGQGEPSSLIDWSARRMARLRYRTLMELVGPGTEGGRYFCPLGSMTAESLGRQLVFDLQPGIGWAGRPEMLTGCDVSRQLLWPGNFVNSDTIGSGRLSSSHSDLVARARVTNVYRVEVELHRVPLRPERVLQIIVPPITWPGVPEPLPANGPYQLLNEGPESFVFTVDDRYFGKQVGQPAEVVERRLEPVQAVAALRAGTIDVIDRVAPWTLPEVQDEAVGDNAVVALQPYAFPLVHCLVPSPNGGLVSRRTFRRALVYGIDRQRILARLLAGRDVPGCEIADGPFPSGYARDPEVAPRPYDPRLAVVLAALARRELAALTREKSAESPDVAEAAGSDTPASDGDAGEKAGGAEDEIAATPLVLAYPPGPVAHAACNLIQRHCAAVGIVVSPRLLTPEEIVGAERGLFPPGVDLLYVELAAWEPVVDAVRLFGPGGLCSHGSSFLQLGLRRLADSADWPAARAALNAIHRAVHDESTVIPLWQLTEYMAFRAELEGAGARPVTLYQNVEEWRPAFRFSSP